MHGIESAMPDRNANVVYRRIGGHDFESTYIEVNRPVHLAVVTQPTCFILACRTQEPLQGARPN